jgi:hypothetical protein
MCSLDAHFRPEVFIAFRASGAQEENEGKMLLKGLFIVSHISAIT